MSNLNLLAVSPQFVLGGAAVLVLLLSTFSRSHKALLWLTAAGFAGTFACVLLTAGEADRRATILLSVNDYALYFVGLLTVVGLVVTFFSYGYLARTERRRGDYYTLLLLATLGATILVESSQFASLFLGLEILSVSLYGLISYPRGRPEALEAGLKYLILAGTTSAFLLLGMALVFAVTGVMDLGRLFAFSRLTGLDLLIYRLGLALIFTGVGFKLAVVPFHLWTPDVYQGAPAPVTAFIATVSKGAILVLLLRYLVPIDPHSDAILFWLISGVAYASMIVGNVLALLQRNIKRLLAYSSIAQLGYLLVPVAAGAGQPQRVAVAFYLTVYSVSLAAAFGVVAILSTKERDAESIEDYRGLSRTRRGLASVFSLSLLSLAGLPITAGFIGKFLLIRSGAGAALWGLLIVLALTSAMSLFYYLRVVMVMLAPAVVDPEVLPPKPGERLSRSLLAVCTLGVLGVALIVLGVYPSPLLHLIDHVALLGG